MGSCIFMERVDKSIYDKINEYNKQNGSEKMLTEERYRRILELLEQKGSVGVVELVSYLQVSESTIRRDLILLDEKGKLKKIHGGAVSLEEAMQKGETAVNIRHEMNISHKIALARKAASLIEEGDIIYIDAGTTTEILIDFIQLQDIVVVTNGIVHAKKLLEKGIKTYIIGGQLKATTEAVVGSEAVEDLKKYNFSKGFFGTNGMSLDKGYTTPDPDEAMVKKAALSKSEKSFIIADASKWQKVSFITFGELDEATIITERTLQDNIGEKIRTIFVDFD